MVALKNALGPTKSFRKKSTGGLVLTPIRRVWPPSTANMSDLFLVQMGLVSNARLCVCVPVPLLHSSADVQIWFQCTRTCAFKMLNAWYTDTPYSYYWCGIQKAGKRMNIGIFQWHQMCVLLLLLQPFPEKWVSQTIKSCNFTTRSKIMENPWPQDYLDPPP